MSQTLLLWTSARDKSTKEEIMETLVMSQTLLLWTSARDLPADRPEYKEGDVSNLVIVDFCEGSCARSDPEERCSWSVSNLVIVDFCEG